MRETTEPLVHGWALRLLGEFQLQSGATIVALSGVQQRLLAFLALQGRAVTREVVASSLWASTDGYEGAPHLRNAVWKARRSAPGVLEAGRERLGVAASLTVDLHRAREAARRLSAQPAKPPSPDAVSLLEQDVLPDWHDDWVVIERERFRQMRLHALETAARSLTAPGRFQEAIDAAGLAVAAEPLRESAHRVLIQAHIAEGNWAEALAQYDRCCRILDDELGLCPTPALGALVAPALLRPAAMVGRGGRRRATS